jgi:hypothetical protein
MLSLWSVLSEALLLMHNKLRRLVGEADLLNRPVPCATLFDYLIAHSLDLTSRHLVNRFSDKRLLKRVICFEGIEIWLLKSLHSWLEGCLLFR